MSGKHSVKVTIGGEEYTLRSEESPEVTRAIAAHVDDAIRRVVNAAPVVEPHRAAILAALQIAGELFAARRDDTALAGRMDGLASELRRWLPPAKRPPG